MMDKAEPRPARTVINLLIVVVFLGVVVAMVRGFSARSAAPHRLKENPKALVSASRLIRHLESLPILQQEEAGRSFANRHVQWRLVVEDVVKAQGRRGEIRYELVLRDPKVPKVEIIAYGLTVRDAPVLRELRQGQTIRVEGRIEEAARAAIVLKESRVVQSR